MRTAGLLLAALALLLAACGGGDEYAYELIIPAGTAERLASGEEVDLMPSRLTFRVGDTIRVKNEDVVDQAVGPYVVGAGQEFEVTFGAPGVYQGIARCRPTTATRSWWRAEVGWRTLPGTEHPLCRSETTYARDP